MFACASFLVMMFPQAQQSEAQSVSASPAEGTEVPLLAPMTARPVAASTANNTCQAQLFTQGDAGKRELKERRVPATPTRPDRQACQY
jgi:hypothetical protein